MPSTFSGFWQYFLSSCAKADSYFYTLVPEFILNYSEIVAWLKDIEKLFQI